MIYLVFHSLNLSTEHINLFCNNYYIFNLIYYHKIMDDTNLLQKMLEKGDKIRGEYKNFDFSTLDATQLKYINRLTFFSKRRDLIVKKFNGTHISTDVKIMFLDQHSMKLGNSVFYHLESKRQEYISTYEVWPYLTAGLSKTFEVILTFRFGFIQFLCHKNASPSQTV